LNLAQDAAGNNLPIQPGFVPLVHEVARYLTAGHAVPGEYTIPDVPAGAPEKPGVVTVAGSRSATRPVAVNVDPREADPTRMTRAAFLAAVDRMRQGRGQPVRPTARDAEERGALWRFALAFGLVTLIVETRYARRAR
jgi:hypothetical protein